MTGKINAAAVQFPIEPGNVEANLGAAFAALDRLARRDIRLAVLPEMWSTGFDYRSLDRGAETTPAVVAEIAEQIGPDDCMGNPVWKLERIMPRTFW